MGVNIKEMTDSRDTVNKWMERFGVRFGVYKKGIFNEQLFPFDSVPRIIPKKDWDYLERGLEQRVRALNMFLWDVYHEKRIIKDVSEAGGYGVVFGSELSPEKLLELKDLIVRFPRRWIAQEVVDFKDLQILDNGELVWRKADLRAFVVTGHHTKVWKSGLTRFSRNPDSFVVNSSQGGGFKDTWVMTE